MFTPFSPLSPRHFSEAKRKRPSRGGFSEGQAPFQTCVGDGAPQDIEEPEPSQPKDAFVASVMAVEPSPLPMMDAGRRQMRQPPEAEKQHQQQPIQPCAVGDHRSFQVPATALEILEGRFDPHSAGVLAHALPSGRSVGEDDPGLVLPGLPSRADSIAESGRSCQSRTEPNHWRPGCGTRRRHEIHVWAQRPRCGWQVCAADRRST